MSSTDQTSAWSERRDDERERAFVEKHGSVNEIAVGTILEYDDWQWALVTELATDRENPMLGFVLLDEVGDYVTERLEEADGCRQHYLAVEHLRDGEHEYWTDIDYVLNDDVFAVLGPIHPDFREDEDANDVRCDGGERFGYSMMTDTWYRVTEYEDLGDGQIKAKSKEEVPREGVPGDVLDATTERGDRDD